MELAGKVSFYNKQVSKLLSHIVYPPLPASGDTGQGYAEVCVSQTSRVHFNKVNAGSLLSISTQQLSTSVRNTEQKETLRVISRSVRIKGYSFKIIAL
jgi:hypothetical protein